MTIVAKKKSSKNSKLVIRNATLADISAIKAVAIAGDTCAYAYAPLPVRLKINVLSFFQAMSVTSLEWRRKQPQTPKWWRLQTCVMPTSIPPETSARCRTLKIAVLTCRASLITPSSGKLICDGATPPYSRMKDKLPIFFGKYWRHSMPKRGY